MVTSPSMSSITFENVAVSAIQDLFEILPARDRPIQLHRLTLHNVGGTADAGDAQEEMLRIAVRRIVGITGGSGGTSPAATAASRYGGGAFYAAETNNTTPATGTAENLLVTGWNIRAPFDHIWTPEERPYTIGYDDPTTIGIVVKLLAAPADAINMSGTLVVEEM